MRAKMSRAQFFVRAEKIAESLKTPSIKYPTGAAQKPPKNPFYAPDTESPDSSTPEADGKQAKRSNKYGNTRCEWRGLKFISLTERDRYIELSAMQDMGQIRSLKHEPVFELMPSVILEGRQFPATTYTADSSYVVVKTGEFVVEDVKGGNVTQLFQHKRKQMKSMYNIEVKLWRKSGDTRGNTAKPRKKAND